MNASQCLIIFGPRPSTPLHLCVCNLLIRFNHTMHNVVHAEVMMFKFFTLHILQCHKVPGDSCLLIFKMLVKSLLSSFKMFSSQ